MSRRSVAAARLAAAYPLVVCGLIAVTTIVPWERGPLALVPILAPHLLLSTLLLVPTYRAIAAGLHDVHRDVGRGPGWTWRPARLASLGVGVLRIDYVLASETLVPLSAAVDCGHPGDHCALLATVGIP